ncbi:MAG: response regulator [Chloroflexi bacterium]|nr:response regulator [Chloroflexota bacterium]
MNAVVPLRVLAVEDDAETAETFRAVLADQGYDIRVARDGRKALAELAGWRPDVMILDLLLPSLSGHALLRYLRGLPEYRRMPILIVSGALPTLLDLDGASVALPKPFELGQLVAILDQLRASLLTRN